MAKKPTKKPTMTAKEAKDFESRSLNRARGGTNKPANKPTLTPSERGGFETKSLKQSRVNPKVTAPRSASAMGSAVEGEARMAAQRAASQAGKKAATTMASRVAGVALGPVAGAIGTGLVLGGMLKNTRPAKAAAEKLTGWLAKTSGLERIQNQMVSNNGALQAPQTRRTSTAPGGTSPTVPSKTVSETPKPTTPKNNASKPSQKAATGSKGRGKAMSGAELANFLGLDKNSAVRTYMETGKHRYPTKGK